VRPARWGTIAPEVSGKRRSGLLAGAIVAVAIVGAVGLFVALRSPGPTGVVVALEVVPDGEGDALAVRRSEEGLVVTRVRPDGEVLFAVPVAARDRAAISVSSTHALIAAAGGRDAPDVLSLKTEDGTLQWRGAAATDPNAEPFAGPWSNGDSSAWQVYRTESSELEVVLEDGGRDVVRERLAGGGARPGAWRTGRESVLVAPGDGGMYAFRVDGARNRVFDPRPGASYCVFDSSFHGPPIVRSSEGVIDAADLDGRTEVLVANVATDTDLRECVGGRFPMIVTDRRLLVLGTGHGAPPVIDLASGVAEWGGLPTHAPATDLLLPLSDGSLALVEPWSGGSVSPVGRMDPPVRVAFGEAQAIWSWLALDVRGRLVSVSRGELLELPSIESTDRSEGPPHIVFGGGGAWFAHGSRLEHRSAATFGTTPEPSQPDRDDPDAP